MPVDPKGRAVPGYEVHAFVCGHERPEGAARPSCGKQGSMDLLKELKIRTKASGVAKVRVQKSGCLDHCEFGPMCVVYPEGTWYSLAQGTESVFAHLTTGQPQADALVRLDES